MPSVPPCVLEYRLDIILALQECYQLPFPTALAYANSSMLLERLRTAESPLTTHTPHEWADLIMSEQLSMKGND